MPTPFGTIRLEVETICSDFRNANMLARSLIGTAAKTTGEIKFYEACGCGDWLLGRCAETGVIALGPSLCAATLEILNGIDGVSNEEISLGEMN